jgi:hypothetical protein
MKITIHSNVENIIKLALKVCLSYKKKGWCRLNDYVYITRDAWKALDHHPAQCWCRTRTYRDNDYRERLEEPVHARTPVVREVWVGARSLECAGAFNERTGTYEPAAESSVSELDREDAAELSEYALMLYHDAGTGLPLIDDPETGERRRIRTGDVIVMARGSNDDLDLLFQDEPNDPRPDRDARLDELFPGAPDYREHDYMCPFYEDVVPDASGFRIAEFADVEEVLQEDEPGKYRRGFRLIRESGHSLHRETLESAGIMRHPDDLDLMREVQRLLDERNVLMATQEQIDQMMDALREQLANDWVGMDRYFDIIFKNNKETERLMRQPKAAPKPMPKQFFRK